MVPSLASEWGLKIKIAGGSECERARTDAHLEPFWFQKWEPFWYLNLEPFWYPKFSGFDFFFREASSRGCSMDSQIGVRLDFHLGFKYESTGAPDGDPDGGPDGGPDGSPNEGPDEGPDGSPYESLDGRPNGGQITSPGGDYMRSLLKLRWRLR